MNFRISEFNFAWLQKIDNLKNILEMYSGIESSVKWTVEN